MNASQQAVPVVFPFQKCHVRVVIDGATYEPLFVGNDICKALGYVDPTTAMRHCKGEMRCVPLQTAGGVQPTRVLSEADVMRLIVKTKLPAAQTFERFMFDRILPEMRKHAHQGATRFVASHPAPPTAEHAAVMHGSAHHSRPPMAAGLPNFADGVAAARAWADAEEGRLQLVARVEQLERQAAEQAPAVEALNLISNTDGSMCLRDAAKVLRVHYNELADLLFKQGWVYRRPGSIWLPGPSGQAPGRLPRSQNRNLRRSAQRGAKDQGAAPHHATRTDEAGLHGLNEVDSAAELIFPDSI